MAKGLNLANLSTTRPDEMVAGGLADDFDAVITKARYVPGKYGKMTKYGLLVKVTYQPDDDEQKPVTEIYSAGDLKLFVPTNDGNEPAGASRSEYLQLANGDLDLEDEEEYEGIAAMRLNAKEGSTVSSRTNFGYFLTKLQQCGFPLEEMSPDIQYLEGLHLHVKRVEKPDQQIEPGQRASAPLVPTEYKGRVKAGKKSAAKSTAKASTASKKAAASDEDEDEDEAPAKSTKGASANGAGDLNSRVYAAITAVLEANADEAEEDEDTGMKMLPKQRVSKAVIDNFKGKEMGLVVKLLGDEDFHENGEGYLFSAEKQAYLFSE